MKTCYIAGPMTGYSMNNFPMFYHAEELLKKCGWACINPARQDDEMGVTTSDTNPPTLREFATRGGASILSLRVEDGDAVILLPHWQFSRGARYEFALAEFLGLDTIPLEEACTT